jgi:hypothetical protein
MPKLTRDAWVQELLFGLGYDDTQAGDVLALHIGTRTISVRRTVRGRRGKIVPGMTTTTTHRIIPEDYEAGS